jgi:hypothetical protein
VDEQRFSRNIALFGRDGQERIFAAKVGIVGLGGLGSHVAQQLSYLGVGELTYVDDDVVTLSSMNRVVGAIEADVDETKKVFVAERVTRQVLSSAKVRSIAERLQSGAARDALSPCGSIFGCLDDDLARLELIELCARARVPCFDLATDTGRDAEGPWYGGRALFSGEGERCPLCMDLLDQDAMARQGMDEAQREVDARIYGVEQDALDETGPAVVGLNGIVASLAVMEWMVWVTGLRAPLPLVQYRGKLGIVTASQDAPSEGCYYCGLWRK